MKNLVSKDLDSVFAKLREQVSEYVEAKTDDVAQAFATSLRIRAKDPAEFPGYQESISVRRNEDGTRNVMADAEIERTVDVGDNVVLTFEARGDDAKKSSSYLILRAFSPMTIEGLAFTFAETQIRTISKRVTAREYEAVLAKTQANRPEILRLARSAGLKARKAAPLNTMSDIGFELLRAELGLESVFSPHWKIAIANLKRDVTKSFQVQNEIFDEHERTQFRTQSETARASQEDFQEKIV